MVDNMLQLEKIEYLKQGHERLKNLISNLDLFQLTELKVLENWTIKDVLSHLAAWNIENIDRIKELLITNKTPRWWNSLKGDDKFNKQEIKKRSNRDFNCVYNEWEESFNNLIHRVEELSDEEWNNHKPIALREFFIYEYYGLDHEGGHAKQIEEFLKKKEESQEIN